MVIFHSVLLTFTRGYIRAARFPGGEHPQQHDRAAGVAALCCGDGPAPFGTAVKKISLSICCYGPVSQPKTGTSHHKRYWDGSQCMYCTIF